MLLKAFCVRDQKMDSFQRPFFMPTDGAAMRAFSDEVMRAAADNPMYQHPEDYALWFVGTFDEESGQFAGTTPRQMLLASECVVVKQ